MTNGVDAARQPAQEDQPFELAQGRLASRTRTAVVFASGSRLAVQVIQFSVTVVMARLLSTHDYGLTAIVTTFTGFAFLFTDLGLGAAVVHRKDLTQRDLSTAFWLNFASGVALTLLFIGLAFPIAEIYGQPALVPLIIVASLTFTVTLNVVHFALLQRGMRFVAIGVIEVSANVVGGAVGILSALGGLGAMSLVLSAVTSAIVSSLLAWGALRWLPRVRPSRAAAREIWGYSGQVFGFNTVLYWSRNADDLILGRVTSLANLALYARAYNLMLLPVYQVTQIVTRVLFPVLVAVRDDLVRMRRGYQRASKTLMTVGMPTTLGLAATAPEFVRTVYGSKWDGVAPLLSILACSGPAQMISGPFGSLYQATGRTRSQFRRGVAQVVITVLAIAIGAFWGPRGVAIALLIKFYALLPIQSRGCLPYLDLRLVDLLRPLRGIAGASLAMIAAVTLVRYLTPGSAAQLVLAMQVVVGIATYFGLLAVLDRDAVQEFTRLIRRRGAR